MISQTLRTLLVGCVVAALASPSLVAQRTCNATGNRGTCSLDETLPGISVPTLRVISVPNPLPLAPTGTTVTAAMYELGFFDSQAITVSVLANASWTATVATTSNFSGGSCRTTRAGNTIRYSTSTLSVSSPTLSGTATAFSTGAANTTNTAQTRTLSFRVPLSWATDGPGGPCTLPITFGIAP